MTKFRWNDPPKEHDAARYNPDYDPKVRFSGTKDGSDLTERQKILNRLIEIDDLLTHYSSDYNADSSTQRGFLLDDDVKKYEIEQLRRRVQPNCGGRRANRADNLKPEGRATRTEKTPRCLPSGR